METDERDQRIKDLQDQLGKAHLIVAQLHQESRDLKMKSFQESTTKSSEGKRSKKALVPNVQKTTFEQSRKPRNTSIVRKKKMQVKEISQLEQRII